MKKPKRIRYHRIVFKIEYHGGVDVESLDKIDAKKKFMKYKAESLIALSTGRYQSPKLMGVIGPRTRLLK